MTTEIAKRQITNDDKLHKLSSNLEIYDIITSNRAVN